MAAPWQDRHTRIVAALKLVLPLLALAILSSLFLFSQAIDPDAAIPYAEVDVEDRLKQPKITDAGFTTVTEDGAEISITAKQAIPGINGAATAVQVQGRIETPDGAINELAAAEVAYNALQNLAELTGGVEMNSAGYVLQTNGLRMATTHVQAETTGPVRGAGPLGQIEAGRATVTEDAAHKGSYLLVFNSGVRLLYTPAKP